MHKPMVDPLTPFFVCCLNGHLPLAQLLLKDPRVDAPLTDVDGRTPLWWAPLRGPHEVIEWLIASGRDLGDLKDLGGLHKNLGSDTTHLRLQE